MLISSNKESSEAAAAWKHSCLWAFDVADAVETIA
jgi:hypothetical protein